MGSDGPIVVLANPAAGHGKAGRLIGRADRIMTELRVEHRIRVSASPSDLETLARGSAEEGASIVAALGGDGTVSTAANGVLGTEAALAVLPAGTGNDFAAAIGARSFDQAVRLLAAPKVHRVDTVKVSTGAVVRHFVNVAGAGFDSEVNEKANATRLRLGTTGTYVAALVRMLPRFTPAHYEIDVDGTVLSVDAMLAIVGSGISYGGGMKVLPSALLDDGELDVCIVEALSVPAFLRAFPRVYRGTHTTHPKVRMMRARRVAVESNRLVPVYADGERIGPLPAIFEIRPSALPVVVGPDAKGIA
jgi:diacylglycerol kinase (ATP)